MYVCMYAYTYVCCACVFIIIFNITVAIDLLQNSFGVDVADKTQVDLYKLEEPLEVCNTFLKGLTIWKYYLLYSNYMYYAVMMIWYQKMV